MTTGATIPTATELARIIADFRTIESDSGDGVLQLSQRSSLNVSSLGKILFPKPKITKGEILRYYAEIWPFLQPVLRDRPLALKRYPNGVDGKFFFQQKAPKNPPAVARVATIPSATGDEQQRLIGGTLGSMLYCAQIGAFECNPWNVRVKSLEYPDFTVIDLDPGPDSPFSKVVEVAIWVREALDHVGLHAAIKTSGATGLHVVIPLPAETSATTAERVPKVIAELVTSAHPRSATTIRAIKQRGTSKVYVDSGQNSRGKTVASAYSIRARPDASVSTPIEWTELKPGLDPRIFTLRTLPARLSALGDLWATAMKKPNPARIVTTL